jgi:hypothetical protein
MMRMFWNIITSLAVFLSVLSPHFLSSTHLYMIKVVIALLRRISHDNTEQILIRLWAIVILSPFTESSESLI